MSLKQVSKRTGRRKAAVTVLGAAAGLSLGGGASAAIVGPAEDMPKRETLLNNSPPAVTREAREEWQ
jgi:hypothetical protein